METHKHIEAYQELFDHMINEHGLTLLQSELDEIIRLSQKTIEKYNEASDGSPFPSTESKCNKHIVIHCQNCNGTNVEKSYVHQNKIYCHDCEQSF